MNQKLAQFAASGAGRRKTVADLLDKVKDALMQARSNGASYRAFGCVPQGSGLPVSEPTLRQYLSAQGAGKRARAKKAGSNRSEPNAQPPLKLTSAKRSRERSRRNRRQQSRRNLNRNPCMNRGRHDREDRA